MQRGRPSPDQGTAGISKRDSAVPSSKLSADDYAVIHDFLEKQAGIRLGQGKEYLITSRLGRVVRVHGLSDFASLAKALKSPSARRLQIAVVDAMTTNETFWFRDGAHYRMLTDTVLPELRLPRVRIWSAACSTGQEPYSIAMALRDARGGTLTQYEIVGTDISPSALQQAREARYCGLSAARGLTEEQSRRFFSRNGDCLDVLPVYRQGVGFREFNLLSPFTGMGRFDVVFCRNVLIYFSAERKRDILERIARLMTPGGYLFLGSTESMNGHADLFEMRSANGGLAYRRRPPGEGLGPRA
jgi:chemotaxis protein methyltransferase CheR